MLKRFGDSGFLPRKLVACGFLKANQNNAPFTLLAPFWRDHQLRRSDRAKSRKGKKSRMADSWLFFWERRLELDEQMNMDKTLQLSSSPFLCMLFLIADDVDVITSTWRENAIGDLGKPKLCASHKYSQRFSRLIWLYVVSLLPLGSFDRWRPEITMEMDSWLEDATEVIGHKDPSPCEHLSHWAAERPSKSGLRQ